ncbi:MAG TPA: DUF535 family protein [Methylocystis sp.]|nr:DUF535 family protein [Methylocystis sp.]
MGASMGGIVTREEVIDFYASVFGRQPASETVIENYLVDTRSVRDLTRKIAHSQELRRSILDDWRTPVYEYEGALYLDLSLDEKLKRDCFFFHHAQVFTMFKRDRIDLILSGELRLFRHEQRGRVLSIVLSRSNEARREGELSLLFKFNEFTIYTFSFSIVPGYAVGLDDERTLLLSRIQGVRATGHLVREATKALKEVAPPAALLAALSGVAKAFGLQHIVGVCATNQLCYREELKSLFNKTYDQFFACVGARGPLDGRFYLDAPVPEKPLRLVKQGHKLRTKAKQKLKANVSESVFGAVQAALDCRFLERVAKTDAAREKSQELEKENAELGANNALLAAEMARLKEEREKLVNACAQLDARVNYLMEENNRVHTTLAAIKRKLNAVLAIPPIHRRLALQFPVALFNRVIERQEVVRLMQAGFDAQFYLNKHGDVRANGICPVLHYVRHGRREQRAVDFAVGPRGTELYPSPTKG